ncbi:oleate hydratase, partial [Staphylococcus epidermidis]|uniref:oleate hydratase n=1 Tax=Staphylococcus epidermidis TaxID=1282 RepID=UPI0037DA2581
MYYTNTNYQPFAPPKKPQNLHNKSPYFISPPLPSLPPPCFLITHAQIKPHNIHILQHLHISPPTLHPINIHHHPYLLPPPRQMQNHFQSLSDLFRTIPSLHQTNPSLLHQFYCL